MLSADGLWVSLKMEHLESESFGHDYISGGLHDFKNSSPERYRLTAKADPATDPNALISYLRLGVEDVCGVKPSVMPPSFVSGLIEFEWSAQNTNETETFGKLTSLIQAAHIGKAKSGPKAQNPSASEVTETAPSAKRNMDRVFEDKTDSPSQGEPQPMEKQCEFCGRTNDGAWKWSECKECGGSYCPEHAEPGEHNCSHIVTLSNPSRWSKAGRRANRPSRKITVLVLALVVVLVVAFVPGPLEVIDGSLHQAQVSLGSALTWIQSSLSNLSPQIDSNWVSKFMDAVNHERMTLGESPLQLTSTLSDFSKMRFDTSSSGTNYEISHYGFEADAARFFGSIYGVGEVVFFPEGSSPESYANGLPASAPGHWQLLMDGSLRGYGFYLGKGPTIEVDVGCPTTEIPGPNINVTQFFLSQGCQPYVTTSTWLVIDMS